MFKCAMESCGFEGFLHENQSRRTCEGVVSHIKTSCNMYVCETCHTYESDVFSDWDPAEE